MRASSPPRLAALRSVIAPAPLLADDDARPAPARATRLRTALLIVAAWSAYSAVMIALFEIARPRPESTLMWSVPVFLAVGAYWAAVTPLVRALTRRLSPARVGVARSVGLHALAALAIAAAGITVRWIAFRVVAPTNVPEPWRLFARLVDYHLVLYALVAVLSAAADAHRAYVARTERALALGAQLAQARLEFLQRQLQPHFLFNALNAAAELTRESTAAAARVLRQLRRLFEAATACRTVEVPLRDELRVLDAYADVQRTRFGDALVVEMQAAPDVLDAAVPPLLLQPLVENAIHHGLASSGGQGRVVIGAERANGTLVLRVHDSGVAQDFGVAPSRRHGIGLRNTEERLARLYGDAGRLHFLQRPNEGTIVTVTIPFRTAAAAAPVAAASPPPTTDGALPSAVVELGEDADVSTVTAEFAVPSTTGAHPRAERWWAPELTWRGIGLLWLACAVCWSLQATALVAFSYGEWPWWRAAVVEVTSAVLWVLLTPIVLWLGRHVRVRRTRWALPLLAHVVFGFVVATVHLWSTYTLGDGRPPRFTTSIVNPLTLDVVIYLLLVAWTHARDFSAWYREREIAAARLEADLRHTRLQSLAVELRPAFVTSLLRRGAELAAVDPARAEAVLERLADVLRALLDAPDRPPTVASETALLADCLALHALAGGRELQVRTQVPAALLDAHVPAGGLRQALDWVATGALEEADAIELVARAPGQLEVRAVRATAPSTNGAGTLRLAAVVS